MKTFRALYGKDRQQKEGIPPGWDYNPSTWGQRLPIVGVAMVGCFIALYMGLYQLDVFDTVWEPFFGDGSKQILNSHISKVLPVPDAILGAFGYLMDAVTGAIGGTKRWKTMPWIVIVFGLAIGPLGLISLLLVVFQPVLLNAWCTLCLTSAFISIVMIGPAIDEMLASLQLLQRAKREGLSLWKVFWGKKEEIKKLI